MVKKELIKCAGLVCVAEIRNHCKRYDPNEKAVLNMCWTNLKYKTYTRKGNTIKRPPKFTPKEGTTMIRIIRIWGRFNTLGYNVNLLDIIRGNNE